MDTPPVESTSKSRSDFSIARILSSDKTEYSTTIVRSENVQVPDWLCCTRYRPPRIPRPVNGGGSRARRSGRHARVPFTSAQATALEAAYARAPYLAPPALRALAGALQLRDDRIKIWFQNRRARERREKCTNITPPLAVTLPSTANAQVSWMSSDCSWNTARDETRSQAFDFNFVIKNEDASFDTHTIFEPNRTQSESSFSETTDEDRADLALDIETIED